MKRIVETSDGGFDAVLGKRIVFYCGVYIYAGEIVGVNDDHIEIDSAVLVYDTGAHSSREWTTAEDLPGPWRIMKQSIESWGAAKC